MIDEDFKTFLEEQLEKIVDESQVVNYCKFVMRTNECDTCPIMKICGKYQGNVDWATRILQDIKILQRKSKLERLLK